MPKLCTASGDEAVVGRSRGYWLRSDDFVTSEGGEIDALELGELGFPRDWPAAYSKSAALKSLIGKRGRIPAKRVAVAGVPLPEDRERLAGLVPQALQSFANAERAAAQHAGVSVVQGWAVFERLDRPTGEVFVAERYWWNALPDGQWVDLTPRPDAWSTLLLAEAAQGAPKSQQVLAQGDAHLAARLLQQRFPGQGAPPSAPAPAPASEPGAPQKATEQRTPAPDPASNLGAAVLQAMRGNALKEPVRFTVYPNVGAEQGEVEVKLTEGADLQAAKEAISRAVLGGSDPARVRIFASEAGGGAELHTLEQLLSVVAHGSLVASDGRPLRPRGSGGSPPSRCRTAAAEAQPRFDRELVGGEVLRVDAKDPELESLLRCPVPVIVTDSGILGKAPELWTFDYLDRALSDVDNFYVLCAPPESKGRFGYYDLGGKKNPCGYEVTMGNERKEMRFPEFRRLLSEAQRRRKAGKKAQSLYLQNTLLHREEKEEGPPKPVGGFGVTCGTKMANDIWDFDWDWLKRVMGDRHPQMCQFFCGTQGDFSPCHYDPQDNLFCQVRGYKRVLLFHPRHFGSIYPWPVHHPQDRQSRVNFDSPDLGTFPDFAKLRGLGLEAVVGPGEALRIPPGWWHHIEMLPSPNTEVVSINFWYPPPRWFYGDIESGQICWDLPLFGVKRVLFQRCVEELIGQVIGPSEVAEVIRVCVGAAKAPAGSPTQSAANAVVEFVSTVFKDPDERKAFLEEVVAGRFAGLRAKVKARV